MRLRKEDVYINLQGKSKEELTELWRLLKNNNQKTFNTELSYFIRDFFKSEFNLGIEYSNGKWCGSSNLENKQEVTTQQLKDILQPMVDKEFNLKGYSVEVDNEAQAKQLQKLAFKQGFEWPTSGKVIQFLNEKFFSFNAYNDNQIHFDSTYFKDKYVTKEIHFSDIFKIEPTLTEQLEKAKAEVERLQKAIEDSNIKLGDWVCSTQSAQLFKVDAGYDLRYINKMRNDYSKITDQDLINKLNKLIK